MHDKEVIAAGVRKGRPAIFVARVQYPERFGIVVVDDNGRILGLEEAPKEPKTDLAVTGAYFLSADIFNYTPVMDPRGEYLINSMLLPYMRDHEVYAEIEKFWIPIGYPGDIGKAESMLSNH
jgi:dTDP-glucose pyrophosphorylase